MENESYEDENAVETGEEEDMKEIDPSDGIKVENDQKEKFVRLSKAEKKLIKAQRMKEKRKAQLQEYKQRKRAKVKESIDEGNNLGSSSGQTKDEQVERLKTALANGLNLCVDLSYEDIHVDRELSSLSRQLSIAYGFLKRFPNPIHLHLCGLRVESVLFSKLQQQGFESWIIDRHNQLPWEIFPIDRLVMLSPDAVEVLDTVDQDKVYIIGGIVDRSVKRAQTLSKAQSIGITTRRFPIQEIIPNRITHILNVDHCIEIMTKFNDSKNWDEVLKAVVPLRKQNRSEIEKADQIV